MVYNSLTTIYTRGVLLKEYTQKTIQELIAKFALETTETVPEIQENILKFETIKDSDRFKKLMPRLLPHIAAIGDPKSFTYTELKTILNWFDGSNSQTQRVPFQPQEAPGVGPQRLTAGNAVGLEIYIAHNYEQAKYLAVEHFGKQYTYCVRIKHHWNNYRYKNNQTFYFVYDPSKPCTDPNHLLVIRPSYIAGGNIQYNVSDAENTDREWFWSKQGQRSDWRKGIIEEQPKLATLKDVIVPIAHTPREQEDIKLGNVGFKDFRGLSYQSKSVYIALGRRIYAEDYALLDNDLQNEYINAQDVWENLEITKDNKTQVVLGFYGLLYPFQISGDTEDNYGGSDPMRKLLGLYMNLKASKIQSFEPILTFHNVIAEGSGPARKRYLYLLERNKQKLFDTVLTYTILCADKLVGLRNNKEVTSILKGDTVDILSYLPSDKQEEFIKLRKLMVSTSEFEAFAPELQKVYIQDWFAREGVYGEIGAGTTRAKTILAPFTDNNEESCNRLLEECNTLEEYADRHPTIKDVETDIKDLFVTELRKYIQSNS